MKAWQFNLLVVLLIACMIMAVTSFLLLGNPIGVAMLAIITGLLATFFPTIPWFLPPVVIWLMVFAIITMMFIAIVRSKP